MKLYWLFFVTLVTSLTASAQRSGSLSANGGRFVGFTIDGDTRLGQAKIYPASTPFFHDDDWFRVPGYSGMGKGIIDVSDSANLRARLQAGENLAFTKRMVGQPYDIRAYFPTGNPANGFAPQFLVDGVYFRDYYANDSSAFTSANKNGQNPNMWMGGYANTGAKSDIIDVYTHVRTSGINPTTDSVWFFAGVSTKNVVGERYFDVEVYREPIYFTPSSNGTGVNFVSLGTDYGHSRWELNSAGNVTRTGDIIISVAYKSGQAPEIDFRIWLAKTTYDSIVAGHLVPTRFKLNGRWDVADDGLHGYAEITADNPSEIWGSGLGNFTGSASADSTYATPWGTINTSGNWSPHYDQLQFVEIGLNFSRFGMNPFQYVTSFCKSPYAGIIVKSRSSTSFSANLDDFVGPVPFTIKDVVPFTVTPDTLTCVKNSARLVWNFSARNYYRLIGPNGDTLARDFDFRDSTVANRYLTVNGPGTYRVEATNFQGCPTMSSQNIVVPIDTIPPTAQVLLGFDSPNFFLRGGDTAASNAMTAFGRSRGLSWYWTGPNGWSSTQQNPVIDTVNTGIYRLRLTEARNGCVDTDSIWLSSGNFVLPLSAMQLRYQLLNSDVRLIWQSPNTQHKHQYFIESSLDGMHFKVVGSIAWNNEAMVTFTDQKKENTGFYRIRAVSLQGAVSYSNVVFVSRRGNEEFVLLRPNRGGEVRIQPKQGTEGPAQVFIVNASGQVLAQANLVMQTGAIYKLSIPRPFEHQTVFVVVCQRGSVVASEKL